jgi:glucokinase
MHGTTMILGGDIGGTHTRLTLFDLDADGAPVDRIERVLTNREFPHFEAALAQVLADAGGAPVSSAALAVAGPVIGGTVRMTNLGWTFDERALSSALGGARVRLLNDLEAAVHGVLELPAADFRVLAAGEPASHGNVAVIAAGTGLGEALLTWHGDEPIAIASEGGHADFAPHGEMEVALLEWLGRSRAHVSWEYVVSGPGIALTYEFLRDSGRAEEPPELRARLAGSLQPAVVITRAALAGEFPICVRTLETFVRAYGAEAGNLALKAMALGGVYVAGGIAPDVLDGPWADAFMRAFVAKGRYEALMRRIPVRVSLSEKASLVGAAAVARRAR